jgi:CubicO group peptidase (beta-lactamase class C family)
MKTDPDEFARRWMRRWKVPGASLAVLEKGRRSVFRAYGFRNREAELPATPRTVYGLASISKSFTAMAILRLEEEGKLSTQDPVVRHLPEFGTPDPRATRKIRIHHFLTHTSGLPPLPSIYYTTLRSQGDDLPYDPRVARRVGIDPDHAPIDTYAQMTEFLRTIPYRLLGPPGRYFSYSNEGFGLLGAVIESVSGQSHESFLEENVLRPAGLRSTTFDPGVLFRYPEVTTLYSPQRTGSRHGFVPSDEWWNDTCLRACGGLRSNVEDLARYLQIYLNDGRVDGVRILASASVRKMTTPYVEMDPGSYYGYGVQVYPDYHGTRLIGHSGGLPGVSSFFAVIPERHLGGVVLTNAEGVSAPRLLMAAINDRLGLPLKTPLGDIPPPITPDAPLREYDGWFCSGEGIWVRSTATRTGLRFDFRGIEIVDKGLPLLPAGHDRFVFRYGGERGRVRFERDPRGRVWALFLGARLLRRRSPRELPRARSEKLVW